MITRSLFYLVVSVSLSLFAACKGPAGDTGPAGPGLTGIETGTVTLVQSDGSIAADKSGVTVSIDGTSFSTTTDASGKWTINGVTTGTYALTFSKQGYGTYHIQTQQFVGGGTVNIARVILSQPPTFTVSLDPLKTITDSNSVYVYGDVISSHAYGPARVLVAVGPTANISASDASTFWYSTNLSFVSSTFALHIYKSDLELAGFTSGQSAFVVLFPIGYGSSSYSSYLDQATGRTVYPAAGTASAPMAVTIP